MLGHRPIDSSKGSPGCSEKAGRQQERAKGDPYSLDSSYAPILGLGLRGLGP